MKPSRVASCSVDACVARVSSSSSASCVMICALCAAPAFFFESLDGEEDAAAAPAPSPSPSESPVSVLPCRVSRPVVVASSGALSAAVAKRFAAPPRCGLLPPGQAVERGVFLLLLLEHVEVVVVVVLAKLLEQHGDGGVRGSRRSARNEMKYTAASGRGLTATRATRRPS